MSASIDTIKLQLAMAFGQGSGVMIASHEALNHLVSGNIGLVERAAGNWDVSHWAFLALMRLFGQLTANRAAAAGSAVIRREDLDALIHVIIDLCPCNEKAARRSMF